eukprot:7082694-Karenia_brevis.AAC.1
MMYRLWTKIRFDLCRQWEADNARQYWWGCAERGTDRCMWRHAMLDESVEGRGLAAVSFLADAEKCFEHVCHRLLLREAIELRFPLKVLQLAIAAYRMPRRLQAQRCLSRSVQARRGVGAGC